MEVCAQHQQDGKCKAHVPRVSDWHWHVRCGCWFGNHCQQQGWQELLALKHTGVGSTHFGKQNQAPHIADHHTNANLPHALTHMLSPRPANSALFLLPLNALLFSLYTTQAGCLPTHFFPPPNFFFAGCWLLGCRLFCFVLFCFVLFVGDVVSSMRCLLCGHWQQHSNKHTHTHTTLNRLQPFLGSHKVKKEHTARRCKGQRLHSA